MCQLLLPTVGDIREAEVASRWQTLLDSGSRTGRELAECWDTLRGEAQECCDYLGEELEGPLASPVEGMGEGRLDCSTRYQVTQQREGLRAKVLSRALSEHHDQTARPVWVFLSLTRPVVPGCWLLHLLRHSSLASCSERPWLPTCVSPPPVVRAK